MLLQAGGIAAATVVVAVVVVLGGAAIPSMTAAVSLGLGVLPALTMRPAVRVLGPRGRILIAVATILFTPFVAIDAGRLLADPVLRTSNVTKPGPTLTVALAVAAVPIATTAVALSWLLIGRARPAFDRLCRWVAPFGLAAAAVVATLAVHARGRRVDAGEWRASLPIVGEVNSDDWQRLADEGDSVARYRVSTHGGALALACPAFRDCEVLFSREGGVPAKSKLHGYTIADRVRSLYRVRSDVRHGLVIVEQVFREGDKIEANDIWAAAFGRDGWVHPVQLPTVRDVIAPPRDWTFVAVFGVAFATGLYSYGVVARRRERARRWVEGRVEADGTIALEDGTRLPSADLEPGVRVIAAGVARGSPTYRAATPGSAAAVMAGTISARRATALDDETGFAACAIAVAAVTITPLLACAAAGLLP